MTTNAKKESTAYYLGYNNQSVSLGYLLESIVCHESNIDSDRQNLKYEESVKDVNAARETKKGIDAMQKDVETIKDIISFLFPDYNQN